MRRRYWVLAALVLVFLFGVGYVQRDHYAAQAANLSRRLIGDKGTVQIEKVFFSFQDKIDRVKYQASGTSEDPFIQETTEALTLSIISNESPQDSFRTFDQTEEAIEIPAVKPAQMVLPQIVGLSFSPDSGEGVWTTAGLPRSSPEDISMARVFVHPDPDRPYATVGVLLVDKRRFRLHITGGTDEPGGDLGVKGPGIIPEEDRRNLVVAWKGGFKGTHGNFGMYADGKTYRPLRVLLASIAVTQDGTIKVGEWGRDFAWTEDTVGVRQNVVLLVDKGEINSRTKEDNDTWGFVAVNSKEFITWRSAVGITKNGDLLIAAGNSLSPATLAQALWLVGAWRAMSLDMNSPYVLISLYFPQEDGTIKSARFMDSMPANPDRYLSRQSTDFMYLTYDNTNYK